jgi:hypothetical protein
MHIPQNMDKVFKARQYENTSLLMENLKDGYVL